MRMQRGQKTSLNDHGIGNRFRIDVDFGHPDTDIVMFGLSASRRIENDRYTVLFSNLKTPEGAVNMTIENLTAAFDVELGKLPKHIDRLLVAAANQNRRLHDAGPLVVTLENMSFDVASGLEDEAAVMMIEIYRHAAGWKANFNGQGFRGGLAELVTYLGGEVAKDETPEPSAMQPATECSPRAPVNLGKVTLEKRQTISLEKKGADFGDIILNLNWNRDNSIFRKAVDLDIGVLFEHRDGRKGVVQALGRTFGAYDQPPYIELSGDDRSGKAVDGETIRINGRHFDKIQRIAVFALIYEGVVRWEQTDARAVLRTPGHPAIEVEISDGENNHRVCGIALIDNENGRLKVTNLMRYFADQRQYAEDVGIHLRWAVGRKD